MDVARIRRECRLGWVLAIGLVLLDLKLCVNLLDTLGLKNISSTGFRGEILLLFRLFRYYLLLYGAHLHLLCLIEHDRWIIGTARRRLTRYRRCLAR